MKRAIAMLLSLMLLFTACAAAEGGLSPLAKAATQLAFHTENVTLKAEAKFSYDGEWFKTFHGEYRQDGYNSYMNVLLDTPRADGSVYTGGYTVVGNDGVAYYSETFSGNYYSSISCEPSRAVLKETTALRSLADLVISAADLLNAPLADAVSLNGNTITVQLENPPQLINSALTLMAHKLIEHEDLDWGAYTQPSLYYDDYSAYLVNTYKKLYGREMPDDIYTNPVEYEAMSAVYEAMYRETSIATEGHIGGVLLIHNDGTTDWYDSEEAYLLADGRHYIFYDSYIDTVNTYYAEKYGQPFGEDVLDALNFSNNPDLWDAYNELCAEIDIRYDDIVPQKADTVALIVHADGTYDETNRIPGAVNVTPTRRITYTLSSLKINRVDAVSTLDESGNILSADGTASFTLIDNKGDEHTLTVEFSCAANDHGTTRVASFNPDDYGLVTFDQFMIEQGLDYSDDYYVDYDAIMESLSGKTVEFAGDTYPIIVDMSDYYDEYEGEIAD